MENVLQVSRDGLEKSIKAVGQSLINKANDIAMDVDGVTTVTIYALLNPDGVVNFDVTKNYIARFKEEK